MDARTGKLLVVGAALGCLAPALSIAAAASHKSPFSAPFEHQDAAQRARAALAAPGASPATAAHSRTSSCTSVIESVLVSRLPSGFVCLNWWGYKELIRNLVKFVRQAHVEIPTAFTFVLHRVGRQQNHRFREFIRN